MEFKNTKIISFFVRHIYNVYLNNLTVLLIQTDFSLIFWGSFLNTLAGYIFKQHRRHHLRLLFLLLNSPFHVKKGNLKTFLAAQLVEHLF